MVTFWVDVYDYADNESFSAYISGYPYLGSTWAWTSAVIIGGVARNFTVRFGDNNTAGTGAEYYVYIGETTDTWAYPQVVVRDVFAGYSSNEWEGDDDGWDVTFATSFANIAKVQSNTLPYGDYNKLINTPAAGVTGTGTANYISKWTNTNVQGDSQITDNGTNVGIGTTAPYRNTHIYQAADSDNFEGALQVGGTSAALGGYFGYNSTISGRLSIISLNNAGSSNAKIYLGFGLDGDGSPTTEVMTLDQNKLVTFGGGLLLPNNGPIYGENTSGTDMQLLAINSSNELTFGSNAVGSAGHPIRFLSKYITFEPAGALGVPVETMRVTNGTPISVGSVGIGTNAPANLLHVYGGTTLGATTSAAGQLTVQGSANSGEGAVVTFKRTTTTAGHIGTEGGILGTVVNANNICIYGAANDVSIYGGGQGTNHSTFNSTGLAVTGSVTASDNMEVFNGKALWLFSTPSSSNYELFSLDKPDAANARLRVYKSGTGTYRGMEFHTGGLNRLTIDSAGAIHVGTGAAAATLGGGSSAGAGATAKDLTLSAWSVTSGTNEYGGDLFLNAGVGTGNASTKPGLVRIKAGTENATSTTSGTLLEVGTFSSTGLAVTGAVSATANVDGGWAGLVSNTGTTSAHGLYVNTAAAADAATVLFRVDKGGVAVLNTTATGLAVTGTGSFSSTLTASSFSGNGASISALNALNISSGTVATARLGSGTANSSVFLRGDNTWATPANTTYTAGVGLTLSSSTTFATKLDELTDMTADVVGSQDELILLDNGSDRRKQINEIKLGQFNNDQGWTTGTVTSVTAGTGMTQSGTSSINPTLNVIGGLGITANANDIALDLNELVDSNKIAAGDKVAFVDINASNQSAICEVGDIPLSVFDNDSGWITSNWQSLPNISSLTALP